jgi:hypothetical protein
MPLILVTRVPVCSSPYSMTRAVNRSAVNKVVRMRGDPEAPWDNRALIRRGLEENLLSILDIDTILCRITHPSYILFGTELASR